HGQRASRDALAYPARGALRADLRAERARDLALVLRIAVGEQVATAADPEADHDAAADLRARRPDSDRRRVLGAPTWRRRMHADRSAAVVPATRCDDAISSRAV